VCVEPSPPAACLLGGDAIASGMFFVLQLPGDVSAQFGGGGAGGHEHASKIG
jgi:hypothetical protein